MNYQQTQYDFVNDYYNKRIDRRKKFPNARQFYENQLKNVTGKRVINIGCGPQFYDDLQHFGEMPGDYFGVDLNEQNLAFLKRAPHPELRSGKALALKNSINIQLYCGDLLEDGEELGSDFYNADCVVSVGFLGIFIEEKFKRAIRQINHWLRPHGRLVNLSWCGNHQPESIYQDRLRHRFNHPDNPGHEEIIHWAQEAGMTLTKEEQFKVANVEEYGWSTISASVFEKSCA